jgi:hypothetical protein
MRDYLRDMKNVIGFAAILAVLLVGMTFVMAGNVAAAPAGNDVTLGAAVVRPPELGSNSRPNFNRLNFNRPDFDDAFIRPAFVRPAFNPFFGAPAISPFFGGGISPFFGAPAISPFFGAGISPFIDDDLFFDNDVLDFD